MTGPWRTEQKRLDKAGEATQACAPGMSQEKGRPIPSHSPRCPPSLQKAAPPPYSLTFFLSLLNFFCSASSSSLSPGGITNMSAPGAGAEPKTSFSTVTTQNAHVVQLLSILYSPRPPGPPTPASGLALTPCLHEAAVQPPVQGPDTRALGYLSPEKGKHSLRRQGDGSRPPCPMGLGQPTSGSGGQRRRLGPRSDIWPTRGGGGRTWGRAGKARRM